MVLIMASIVLFSVMYSRAVGAVLAAARGLLESRYFCCFSAEFIAAPHPEPGSQHYEISMCPTGTAGTRFRRRTNNGTDP
jgi:hypothetical protein